MYISPYTFYTGPVAAQEEVVLLPAHSAPKLVFTEDYFEQLQKPEEKRSLDYYLENHEDFIGLLLHIILDANSDIIWGDRDEENSFISGEDLKNKDFRRISFN
ncbi:hypothetical protein ACU8KH_04070 [Lachancea thermotolerans]